MFLKYLPKTKDVAQNKPEIARKHQIFRIFLQKSADYTRLKMNQPDVLKQTRNIPDFFEYTRLKNSQPDVLKRNQIWEIWLKNYTTWQPCFNRFFKNIYTSFSKSGLPGLRSENVSQIFFGRSPPLPEGTQDVCFKPKSIVVYIFRIDLATLDFNGNQVNLEIGNRVNGTWGLEKWNRVTSLVFFRTRSPNLVFFETVWYEKFGIFWYFWAFGIFLVFWYFSGIFFNKKMDFPPFLLDILLQKATQS